MSRGVTRETTVYNKNINRSSDIATRKTELQLAALDVRLDEIRQNQPKVPHLLSIQTRQQYHLTEYQKDEFRESETGFKPEERDWQYLSFLDKGWDNTILSVLKYGPGKTKKPTTQAMASASSTPKTVANKTSIADYKKRSSLPVSGSNGSAIAADDKSRAVSSMGTDNSSTLKRNSDVLDKPKSLAATGDEPPTKKLKPSPRLGPNNDRIPSMKSKISLPPPLSPTLPAFVEKLLAKGGSLSPSKPKTLIPSVEKKESQRSVSPAPAKKSTTSTTKINKSDTSIKSISQTTKPVTNGVHRSSASQDRARPTGTSESGASKGIAIVKDKLVKPPSVLLRLKIPQHMRKDVSRLLRLPPRRTKEKTPLPKSTMTSQGEKTLPDKLSAKPAEKRPRGDDDHDLKPDAKRPKSPMSQDRAASKRPRETTPAIKEEVTTPQAAAFNGTPVPSTSASRTSREKQTPSESGSVNQSTSERLEGLQKLQTKYSELGRVLKKEGDKLTGPEMTPAQRRKFVASRIETTLAFILSYTIGDEVLRLRRRSPKPEATWNTLFGWIKSVHELVSDHTHLSGLLLHLEAISQMVVWRQRSELFEGGESFPLDKIKELRSQHEQAQAKFLKGSARLSVHDLQEEFPKTWKAIGRTPLADAGFKMTKDNLNGDFYLPLSATSLPIEGVRAGKALLAEWCRREGVDWTMKLDF